MLGKNQMYLMQPPKLIQHLSSFFFQVMDDSRPWLDMAHVVSNLNKLDAGIADKIWLVLRALYQL